MFNTLFKFKTGNNDVNVDVSGIDLEKVPQHIAIIMDGNGRWAKAQGKPRTFGHQAGAETLKNIKVRFMGSRDGLPEVVRKKMDYAEKVTAENTGIVLNLAINYGGQAEILHAVQNIVSDVQNGSLKVEDIDAQHFEDYLYTKGLPAPDLLIRPGGDLRISNFMLWQIAYAEIWTTDVYWPAFTPEMFLEAVKAYGGRERRYGGLITK